ncbi:MAG: hypothetical protein ACK5Z2_02955 [Bacteroidota bacterium]|jgi:hypothetical protein
MKKLALIFGLVTCFSLTAEAQVTKAQVETSLKEMNITMDDVVEIYIANTIVFYSDGTNKHTYEKYNRTVSGGGVNKFSLTDNGLKITFEKDGTVQFVKIIPFSMITNIEISKAEKGVFINVALVE